MYKILIAATLLVSACKNPNYCAGNPDNNCNETGDGGTTGSDGGESISCVNTGCVGNAAGSVCDTDTKACVQCTDGASGDHSACTLTTPVCRADVCGACLANSDCPESNTCLPSGACAVSTDVAYVDASVTGGTCTKTDPCSTIGAAKAVHSIIRVTGRTSESLSVNASLTIIGEHSTEVATSNQITSGVTASAGSVIMVSGSANLTMVDMAIDGGASATYAINNAGVGTVVLDHCSFSNTTTYGVYSTGGTFEVHRSFISKNKVAGINFTNTMFAIDNSFVVNNGDINSAATFGGIYLSASTGTITFSTIAKNRSLNTTTPQGVNCSTATVQAFTNNIVYYNTNGPSTGSCAWSYSELDTSAVTAGAGNINTVPLFKDLPNDDFHLLVNSPGQNAGSGALKIDFDAQQRPMGSGPDIGADEVQ